MYESNVFLSSIEFAIITVEGGVRILRRFNHMITLSSGQTLEVTIDKTDEKPIGILHILHGVSEHKDRYDGIVEYFCKRGFHVIRHNHRGHGKKIEESTRGHFNSLKELVEDLKEIRDTFKPELNNDLPYILLGHSMGSLVARKYVHDYPDDVNILILSGTVVYSNIQGKLNLYGLKFVNLFLGNRTKSKLINNLAFKTPNRKHKELNKDNNWISESEENKKIYEEDPYTGYSVSHRVFLETVKAAEQSKKSSYIKKQNLNMPILLLSGKEDHFGGFGTGIKKLATLYKRNGVKHVTVQLYKNKRHEVLFETNQSVVYEHIFNWLMTQIKQLEKEEQ
ncbi:alpha/beta fold hydrolase [Mammaliicoccus lentus]|uniref:alpha/beta fold hydrolase n=1 Tax=Mammaliicoccus lentus TaxID=42858 RepID=UPI0024A8CDB3|nr:alpha/beta fold hydrolase [Mammaliicoccus lentus]MDQ7142479.1 alpha/beta fold hydrolase [Mammaliicoccus lentus]WHI53712.1 alpha/beta fold hydrolase [Mammaliicoccus lentus]WHI56300.1 alpha/beta fold hydrolase [Mammaliicoccus lentus]